MQIQFYKYQGTGNDFIIIDDRDSLSSNSLSQQQISFLCHRHFGIGADGLILLKSSESHDFKMVYYNSDGHESSMCGNGGRCIVHFAHQLKIFTQKTTFEAIDGLHEALLTDDDLIHLKMLDVQNMSSLDLGDYTLNTGSPHYVTFCKDIPFDIKKEGAIIRYSSQYKEQGINVNFVKETLTYLEVATYERGVEDETLSCGTGVTAVSLAHAFKNKEIGLTHKTIRTKGGELKVSFDMAADGSASNIWLIGPATRVYNGVIEI